MQMVLMLTQDWTNTNRGVVVTHDDDGWGYSTTTDRMHVTALLPLVYFDFCTSLHILYGRLCPSISTHSQCTVLLQIHSHFVVFFWIIIRVGYIYIYIYMLLLFLLLLRQTDTKQRNESIPRKQRGYSEGSCCSCSLLLLLILTYCGIDEWYCCWLK